MSDNHANDAGCGWCAVRLPHVAHGDCDGLLPHLAEGLQRLMDHQAGQRDDGYSLVMRLIDQHASHGFTGVMRSPEDGCPVYVAAVALFDALGTCPIPPEAAASGPDVHTNGYTGA